MKVRQAVRSLLEGDGQPGYDLPPEPTPERESQARELLLHLAREVALLTPATRAHNPGIGAGQLNHLIDTAKKAIALAERTGS